MSRTRPRTRAEDRIDAGDDFYRVMIRYGFMEPDVPLVLDAQLRPVRPRLQLMDTTYFASRETIVAGYHRGMPIWRDKLFALMTYAAPATGFFRIPGNRLVEGAQVEI